MRRIVTSLLLSFFLISGTGVAFADRHNDRDRKEYRHNDRRHDNGKKKGHDNKSGKHSGMKPGPANNFGNPGPAKHFGNPGPAKHVRHKAPQHQSMRPTPPPPGHNFHANLGPMVHHAGRGARDVQVWQINPTTYIMRYWLGGHYYTRYLYPGSGRYGRPALVSVNWSPMTPWIPVPSISLNINL